MKELYVKDLDGHRLDLNGLYPNSNLLIVFYNNQCLGCTGRALPLAYEFSKEFKEVQLIGIHSDFGEREVSKEEILGVFTNQTLPFPIYKDIEQRLYYHFKCEGTPHWILLNKDREVLNSIFGSQEGAQNRLFYALGELSEKESS